MSTEARDLAERIQGVAFLLVKEGAVLMEKCPKKAARHGAEWFIPGGRIEESDESGFMAFYREMLEELGVTARRYQRLPLVDACGGIGWFPFLIEPYLVQEWDGELPDHCLDHPDVPLRWVPIEEAQRSPSRAVRAFMVPFPVAAPVAGPAGEEVRERQALREIADLHGPILGSGINAFLRAQEIARNALASPHPEKQADDQWPHELLVDLRRMEENLSTAPFAASPVRQPSEKHETQHGASSEPDDLGDCGRSDSGSRDGYRLVVGEGVRQPEPREEGGLAPAFRAMGRCPFCSQSYPPAPQALDVEALREARRSTAFFLWNLASGSGSIAEYLPTAEAHLHTLVQRAALLRSAPPAPTTDDIEGILLAHATNGLSTEEAVVEIRRQFAAPTAVGGERRELLCMICGKVHPTWHAPSWLWNAVQRTDGVDEWPFLCPTCFAVKAVERGHDYHFVLAPEGDPHRCPHGVPTPCDACQSEILAGAWTEAAYREQLRAEGFDVALTGVRRSPTPEGL